MDDALRELINAIKDLSPAVWEAALVRVQVNAWLDFGLAGVFLIIGISLAWFSYQCFKKVEHKGEDEGVVGLVIVCGLFAVFCLLPIIGNLYYGFLYLFSPEWSAIQLILEKVK